MTRIENAFYGWYSYLSRSKSNLISTYTSSISFLICNLNYTILYFTWLTKAFCTFYVAIFFLHVRKMWFFRKIHSLHISCVWFIVGWKSAHNNLVLSCFALFSQLLWMDSICGACWRMNDNVGRYIITLYRYCLVCDGWPEYRCTWISGC